LFNHTLGRDGLILAQPVSDLLSMLLTVLLFLPIRRELAGNGNHYISPSTV
jgi:hypothetical protein